MFFHHAIYRRDLDLNGSCRHSIHCMMHHRTERGILFFAVDQRQLERPDRFPCCSMVEDHSIDHSIAHQVEPYALHRSTSRLDGEHSSSDQMLGHQNGEEPDVGAHIYRVAA